MSTATADPIQERKDRRAKRLAVKQGSVSADEPAFREAAVLGMPEPAKVGTGLSLELRAPVVRRGAELHASIARTWPDVLVLAWMSDPSGTGIDFGTLVAYAASLDPENSYTTSEARRELQIFTAALFAYDAESEKARRLAFEGEKLEARAKGQSEPDFAPHVLESIADHVAELAIPFTEGVTREALPELLMNHLRPVQFADLLRSLMAACHGAEGRFEGDPLSRFPESNGSTAGEGNAES